MKNTGKLLLAAVVTASVMGAQADTFVGPGSDWADGVNWGSGTAPGASIGVVYVVNNATADYTAAQGTTAITADFNVGRASDGGAGTMNLTGGTLNVTGGIIIGQQTTGVLNINGGSLQAGTANFRLGNGGGNGTINLSAGVLDIDSTGDFNIGRNGATGLLTISGGTADFAKAATFSNGSVDFTIGSTGSLTVAGADEAYYTGLFGAGNLTRGGTTTGTFAENFNVTGSTITAIPEPATLGMLALFGGGMLFVRRKMMI